jgi:hypothetical protein
MVNFDLVEVVEKLIGETEPCGESNEDFNRWHNQKALIMLVDCLTDTLIKNSKYSDSEAGSESKIGVSAENALDELTEKLTGIK